MKNKENIGSWKGTAPLAMALTGTLFYMLTRRNYGIIYPVVSCVILCIGCVLLIKMLLQWKTKWKHIKYATFTICIAVQAAALLDLTIHTIYMTIERG